MSSCVKALKMVLANGDVLECSNILNQDVFRAALCSLGALGVVVEVTLATSPSSSFLAVSERILVNRGTHDIDFLTLTKQCPLSKVYVVGPEHVLLLCDQIELKAPPLSTEQGRSRFYKLLKRLEGFIFSIVLLLLAKDLAVALLGLWYRFVYAHADGIVVDQPSSPVLEIPQFTCEYAVPSAAAQGVFRHLNNLVLANPSLPMHFAEVRFVAGDSSALIAPTSGEGLFVYIGVVSYKPFGFACPQMKELFLEFERICKVAGGRPHWAKEHGFGPDDFANAYGKNLEISFFLSFV